MGFEVTTNAQQRLFKNFPVHEQIRDQQSSKPTVTVKKRVDRLKLRMDERRHAAGSKTHAQ